MDSTHFFQAKPMKHLQLRRIDLLQQRRQRFRHGPRLRTTDASRASEPGFWEMNWEKPIRNGIDTEFVLLFSGLVKRKNNNNILSKGKSSCYTNESQRIFHGKLNGEWKNPPLMIIQSEIGWNWSWGPPKQSPTQWIHILFLLYIYIYISYIYIYI